MTLPRIATKIETKEANRKAQNFLTQNVVNDFTYHSDDSQKDRQARRDSDARLYGTRGEVAWTQRRYSSSDEYTSCPNTRKGPNQVPIVEAINDLCVTKSQRQSRLRRRLDEECKTNPGLEHFCARRDAWTCARSQSLRGEPDLGASRNDASTSSSKDLISDDSPAITPTSSVSSTAHASVTLLPIPQPILPDHPIRARIGKGSYSDIYMNIVTASRRPAIPINLVHMTRALVHGWKEEGNWPPKESAPEPSMGKKKVTPLKKSVQAVGRAFNIGQDVRKE